MTESPTLSEKARFATSGEPNFSLLHGSDEPQEIDDWDLTESWQFKIPIIRMAESPTLHEKAEELKNKLQRAKDEAMKEFSKDPDDDDDPMIKWQRQKQQLEALSKLWQEITPQQFVICLSTLVSDPCDFLVSFKIVLRQKDWTNWKWLESIQYKKASMVLCLKCDHFPRSPHDACTPSGNDNLEDGSFAIGDNLEDLRLFKNLPTCVRFFLHRISFGHLRSLLFRERVCKFDISWISAPQLVEPARDDVLLHILRALYTCSDMEVFNTVIGRTILRRAWARVQIRHWFFLLGDVSFLCLLGFIVYTRNTGRVVCTDTHHVDKAETPIKSLTLWWYGVIILALWRALSPLCEVMVNWTEFGFVVGFAASNSLAKVFSGILDTFTACAVCVIGYYRHYKQESSCLHPVFIAWALLAQWLHLIMSLMCSEQFGENVLPAFYAATRAESLWFMAYCALAYAMSMQTYWSFPIAKTHSDDLTVTMMKIFKLDFLGDVDAWEMEGVDNVIENNTIDNGAVSPLYHQGVSSFIVVISVLVSILSMSIFIGIVGNLYNEGRSNKKQLHCHFICGRIMKLLVTREFLAYPLYYWGCCQGKSNSRCRKRAEFDDRPALGYIIGYDPKTFMDGDDVSEKIDDMKTCLAHINAGTVKMLKVEKQVTAKLDAVLQQIKSQEESQNKQVEYMKDQLDKVLKALQPPLSAK